MTHKFDMKDDEVFVKGRSQEKALGLLEAAKKAGVDTRRVKSTSQGFIVPKKVLDAVEEESPGGGPKEQAEPADSDTEADSGAEESKEFDPNDHSVEKVKAYLEGADEGERERVITAEKEGKARKTLLTDDEGKED